MGVIYGSEGVYSLGPDGKKRFADSTHASMNGEDIFRFNPAVGKLELSADEASIAKIVEFFGGYPIEHLSMTMPPIGGKQHFHNVREIVSLPKKDGSFLIKI